MQKTSTIVTSNDLTSSRRADPLAGEGYVVIRDALKKTGKVGLAQITLGGREWLVAISPLQDGLCMAMLRYADELRRPEDFFDEVPSERPAKEMVDLGSAHHAKGGRVQTREVRKPLSNSAEGLGRSKGQGQEDYQCSRRGARRWGQSYRLDGCSACERGRESKGEGQDQSEEVSA